MNVDVKVPHEIQQSLNFVCTQQRTGGTSPGQLVLALSLLSLQVFRRLYECAVINQSSTSTMNITHYIVGFAHYFCAATGYLCEAPGFLPNSSTAPPAELSVSTISLAGWLATIVFLGAWYQQLQAHKTFAQLKRKNAAGHSIPDGGLFDLVSCPHYLCEIIIYTCLLLILGPSHQTALLGETF